MRLKDQVAIVTGGSRGIGRAIVKALAAEGAKVAFIYRGSQQAAEALAQEVLQTGGTVLARQCDVVNFDDAQKCVEGVEKEWGQLDILVNNAGVIKDDLFVRMEPEAWQTVLQTNLGGTFNFCKAVAYTMMKQRRGRIINISSVAAEHVNPGQTNYAASKGAINAFTRALAVELASRNVTVNAIAPGFIETDMSEAVRNKAGDLIKKMIPMRRLGQPDDIARVAVFLASADAAYLTGQVMTVDGGLSLRRCRGVKQARAGTGNYLSTWFSIEEESFMPSQEEIYTKVSATLVEALNVDEEEIKPTSTLQGDLGAESIDFLDIVFRLEREFGIKIPRGELFPESIFQGDPEFVQDGKVTDRGLEELRTRMPFADMSKFEKNPELTEISDLFTVEMITRYIQGKLSAN